MYDMKVNSGPRSVCFAFILSAKDYGLQFTLNISSFEEC